MDPAATSSYLFTLDLSIAFCLDKVTDFFDVVGLLSGVATEHTIAGEEPRTVMGTKEIWKGLITGITTVITTTIGIWWGVGVLQRICYHEQKCFVAQHLSLPFYSLPLFVLPIEPFTAPDSHADDVQLKSCFNTARINFIDVTAISNIVLLYEFWADTRTKRGHGKKNITKAKSIRYRSGQSFPRTIQPHCRWSKQPADRGRFWIVGPAAWASLSTYPFFLSCS